MDDKKYTVDELKLIFIKLNEHVNTFMADHSNLMVRSKMLFDQKFASKHIGDDLEVESLINRINGIRDQSIAPIEIAIAEEQGFYQGIPGDIARFISLKGQLQRHVSRNYPEQRGN